MIDPGHRPLLAAPWTWRPRLIKPCRRTQRGSSLIAVSPLPPGFTLLQVVPRLESGGVERVTVDTALAVAAAGARSLVASHGGAMEAELRAGGVETVRLPVHSRNPAVMAANARSLRRLIAAERVSLVHVRSRAPAFSAIAAARAAGIPIVATYHGIYQARSPWKRWYNAVMTRGDLVIANSRFTRDHIVAEHGLDPGRIVVAPEGVDTGLFDPAQLAPARIAALRTAWGVERDQQRPILLLAARLTGWKGQGVMIEALRRLAGPDGPLLLLAGREQKAGEGRRLLAMAASAGVGTQVRLTGPVADMPAALALADLVVAPSTLPESFGRTVVEAAAMERPVLASPLGGPSETVVPGETGWLVPAGDPAAWAEAVAAALAAAPEARARMGRAARARAVERYSLAAMVEATFDAYRRVAEARR